MSDYCLIVIKTSRGNCVLSSMQRLAGATLLVFANKQDLPGALSKEAIREVRLSINLHYMVIADLSSCQITVVVYQWQTQCVCFLQALALDKIKTHHWCIIGCSAVTGENLLDGVDWLLDDIAARIFTADWACYCCFSCGELWHDPRLITGLKDHTIQQLFCFICCSESHAEISTVWSQQSLLLLCKVI